MKYFSTLPKIITSDGQGGVAILTNLMARASVISGLLTDPLLFYSYDIQEGDTPEIIAHKYYDDMYRYWIILVSNEIMDPQWSWPLSNDVLSNYITEKYGMASSDVHHYEKVITQYDHDSEITTVNTIVISEEEYNSPTEPPATYTLPTGTVSVSTEKNVISNYEYEERLNESKRSIKLLNKNYVNEFETQLKKLMK
jgi:hypothetical protein